MVCPTSSLSSSSSNLSSCSEFSVDAYSSERINRQNNASDINQENSLRVQKKSVLDSNVVENHNLITGMEANGNHSHVVRDVEIMEPTDSRGGNGNPENTSKSFSDEIEVPFSFGEEMWEPPAAEDPVDDIEGSVADNEDDDDDECGDGTKWGKPSSLCHLTDQGNGSYKFKEDKQRVIKDLTYEKFKALVSKLLKSVGVSVAEESGESWIDIVTSLSWEAVSCLKPEAADGKGVGMDGLVKVKCIATGSRSQSKIFKGLVFKKHAAHKRMPTNFKKPKLLLIRGVLGESTSVLSSLETKKEEKDYMKPIREILDKCNPNVILVEKTVSRDVQECILQKEMTLVLDMKLHRLERVSQYTGSTILPSNALMAQKFKQCESFYFEKFLEEHAGLREGRKQSKTLMFIEGGPTCLGCTILLKGSHSDELKKVKCVARCAVVMAHRLILETSFLLDQKAMFSTIGIVSDEGLNYALPCDQVHLSLPSGNATASNLDNSSRKSLTVDLPFSDGFHERTPPSLESCNTDHLHAEDSGDNKCCTLDVPISNGFHENGHINSNSGSEGSSAVSDETSFPTFSSYEALSAYFGISGYTRKPDTASETSEAVNQCHTEAAHSCNGEKSHDIEEPFSYPECTEDDCMLDKDAEPNKGMQDKDKVSTVLDSQGILVLMSSRNAIKGTVCKQSRFSHIKFYQHFDIPLGKYFRDNIFNQGIRCTACGELPEFHFYYYAHHNKQLTIQVKRLPSGKHLPGEAEGKLWMWSRCAKCKCGSSISESTKRVLISNASRGLSFGKFLELGLSQHAFISRASGCGHSLQKDFIYFFGSGPMAAMFRYSPVVTYDVIMPPLELEFNHSVKEEFLVKDIENVLNKGIVLFTEVENSMKNIRHQFSGLNLNLGGSLQGFSDVEDMLKQEKYEFEMNIQSAFKDGENTDQAACKPLSLNRFLWELLLESCIWERRLHALLSSRCLGLNAEPTIRAVEDQDVKVVGAAEKYEQRHTLIRTGNKDFNDHCNLRLKTDPAVEANDMLTEEIPIETSAQDSEEHTKNDAMAPSLDDYCLSRLSEASCNKQSSFPGNDSFGCDEYNVEKAPGTADNFSTRTIEISTDEKDSDDCSINNTFDKRSSLQSLPSSSETSTEWFWMPFNEIRQIDMKLFQRMYLPKIESISSYTSEYLPNLYQMITEEGSRVHIPLGIDNYMVSDFEGEVSSIIACALAFLNDNVITKVLDDDSRRESIIAYNDSFHNVASSPTIMLSHWSSTVSDPGMSSISSEEIRFSSFDGLNLLDSLGHSESLHPEVSLGNAISTGKSRKYSVICLYATHFRHIRSRCCPSELDFIASLSRCRSWDAKGGKSKAIFAKTLDDRFVIKEIKRTELESFMKFGQGYFSYINQSYEGNQSCLAKVFGVYQVVIRQPKSGREMKHDVMVIENLNFGRSISRQYDLKGALHARYISAANVSGEVLLDQNFVDDMNSSPLYISKTAKRILERAIWNDTTFLNSINVMDYSLLVGVDTQRRELACGIIDYLRQYTWDKQLETWVKSSFSVPKNATPTIVSPDIYKKRFRKFFSTYFLSVPDNWCSQKSSL